MEIRNGFMLDEDITRMDKTANAVDYPSRFNFLSDHNGLRRGEIHCLIAPKGGGKSSLVRGVMLEQLCAGKSVLCYLSEESCDRYMFEMNTIFKHKTDEERYAVLSNLTVFSELEMKTKNALEEFKSIFNNFVEIKKPDLFIFDNLTTSAMCENLKDENDCFEFFKQNKSILNIPLLLVMHTKKGARPRDGFLDGEDVRGSAKKVNVGSYNYVLQTFFELENPRSFLSIDKARYHRKANKNVYELTFSQDGNIYKSDKKSSYDEVIETIKMIRDKNSGKKKGTN